MDGNEEPVPFEDRQQPPIHRYDESRAGKRLHTTVAVLRGARHVGVVPDSDVRGFAWSRSAVEAMDAGAVRAAIRRDVISPYEVANRVAAALDTPASPASHRRCPPARWSS
ncbi:hypothetical protein AB0953_32815 [Streptomyces sp. NPDC046866]|uniref:hypothetical protein n=1 Tax=Streptomyces sp. NPDC046866 TaxID=3154921 RepID=UPI003453103B